MFEIGRELFQLLVKDKFEIESSRTLKMYGFVVDTMQRLYRLWKCRLHYYYKSPKCGKDDAELIKNPPPDVPLQKWKSCVKHFGSPEFKLVSERNSKNRLSTNRCIHTTRNWAFVEVEDVMTKENGNVKPSADVIWLIEHTHYNGKGELERADGIRSKEVHDKMKDVVSKVGDSMTQEEILIQVLGSRSGHFRGKGSAIRAYCKNKQQPDQNKLVSEQQEKIQE